MVNLLDHSCTFSTPFPVATGALLLGIKDLGALLGIKDLGAGRLEAR
jgi:hypothetical protein